MEIAAVRVIRSDTYPTARSHNHVVLNIDEYSLMKAIGYCIVFSEYRAFLDLAFVE